MHPRRLKATLDRVVWAAGVRAAGWGGTGDPLHPGVAPVTVSARAAGQSSMHGGESGKGKSAHKHKAIDAESRQGPLAMPTPTGMHHVG